MSRKWWAIAAAAMVLIGCANAQGTGGQAAALVPDNPPAENPTTQQSTTPQAYLDYLFPILQKEPALAKPMLYSNVRPIDANDAWLNEFVRITGVVHCDVWTDGTDWQAAETLAKTHGAIIALKIMPFQITGANTPDNRYDLSQPMNADVWQQLRALSNELERWINRPVAVVDMHSELWPWPDDTNYGTGTTAEKYANRLHRYKAATSAVRSAIPAAKVFWYYYSSKQKHPGDVYYLDRSANHTNEWPALSDAISPEMYRPQFPPDWYMTCLQTASGFENAGHRGQPSGKPIVPLVSIYSAYKVRSAPDNPNWSQMKGWNWWPKYPDGNDYQIGALLYRAASRGESQAYLDSRIVAVWIYGHPWYLVDACQTPHWQAEFWRRFLIFCRGARAAAISDLERPNYRPASN